MTLLQFRNDFWRLIDEKLFKLHQTGSAAIMLLVLQGIALGMSAQTLYSFPKELKPSPYYQVFINGKEAFVYDSPVPAAFCAFELTGSAEVVVKSRDDIKWVDIRPKVQNIIPSFQGNEIRFQLSGPGQLSIELNGKIATPLFLFANAPETNKPRKGDKGVYFFEAGKMHFPGLIQLKDNETVYIEGGAVVAGVIHARNAKNVKVLGSGVLDGSYNRMLDVALAKGGVTDSSILYPLRGKYHRFLEFTDCSDVLIEGVILSNSTSWQVVPIHCSNVAIHNIKIVSEQASDDGIDIVRSENVTIKTSFIRTKDDCIAIKAHMNYPPDAGVRNILVEDCIFWNSVWGNAIEIGFELEADYVEDITFRNCDVIHVEYGAVFSIHNASNSHVRRVLLEKIRIEDARHKLFDLAIFRSKYSKIDGTEDPRVADSLYLHGIWDNVMKISPGDSARHATYRGMISDITLKNIEVEGIFPFSVFRGFDKQHLVSKVIIDNLIVNGRRVQSVQEGRMRMEYADQVIVK